MALFVKNLSWDIDRTIMGYLIPIGGYVEIPELEERLWATDYDLFDKITRQRAVIVATSNDGLGDLSQNDSLKALNTFRTQSIETFMNQFGTEVVKYEKTGAWSPDSYLNLHDKIDSLDVPWMAPADARLKSIMYSNVVDNSLLAIEVRVNEEVVPVYTFNIGGSGARRAVRGTIETSNFQPILVDAGDRVSIFNSGPDTLKPNGAVVILTWANLGFGANIISPT